MKADSGLGLDRKTRGQGRGQKKVWEGNGQKEQGAALRRVVGAAKETTQLSRGWLEQLGLRWGKGHLSSKGLAAPSPANESQALEGGRKQFQDK